MKNIKEFVSKNRISIQELYFDTNFLIEFPVETNFENKAVDITIQSKNIEFKNLLRTIFFSIIESQNTYSLLFDDITTHNKFYRIYGYPKDGRFIGCGFIFEAYSMENARGQVSIIFTGFQSRNFPDKKR